MSKLFICFDINGSNYRLPLSSIRFECSGIWYPFHDLYSTRLCKVVFIDGEANNRKKYVDLLQCQGLNLANTSFYYARFTQTVLCAQIVQESIAPCGLSSADAYVSVNLIDNNWCRPPVCASTCADFATSEEVIAMTPDFCGGNTSAVTDSRVSLIRADFTVCALPANSLRYLNFENERCAKVVLHVLWDLWMNLKTADSEQTCHNYVPIVDENHQTQHLSAVSHPISHNAQQ